MVCTAKKHAAQGQNSVCFPPEFRYTPAMLPTWSKAKLSFPRKVVTPAKAWAGVQIMALCPLGLNDVNVFRSPDCAVIAKIDYKRLAKGKSYVSKDENDENGQTASAVLPNQRRRFADAARRQSRRKTGLLRPAGKRQKQADCTEPRARKILARQRNNTV